MARHSRTRKPSKRESLAVLKFRRRFRPKVEVLEDRILLSTFTVNNLGDAGTGSGNVGDLRYCINQANANNQANSIGFDSTVFATHKTITLAGSQLTLSDTGGTQTITAPAAGVTIDAAGKSRVLLVQTNVTASVSGVTVSNGSMVQFNPFPTGGPGGGILNWGNLTVTNSSVTGNAAFVGGGLYNTGTLSLTNSTVSGNVSLSNGGGIYNHGTLMLTTDDLATNKSYYDGGALFQKQGTVTLSGCTVSGNKAVLHGAGLALQGMAQVTNSTFSGNTTGFSGTLPSFGAGIAVFAGGILNLTGGSITGNNAIRGEGGALFNDGTAMVASCTISTNQAQQGGGIDSDFHSGSTNLMLTGSTVTGNTASQGAGGGIYNGGATLTLTHCTVSSNSATLDGGGLKNFHVLTMTDCTLSDNTAPAGGGLSTLSGPLPVKLLNCTISGNHAVSDGGGIGATGNLAMMNCTVYGNTAYKDNTTPGTGGGISATFGVLTNCTIADNRTSLLADTGGLGGDLYSPTNKGVTLNNSLIAYSTHFGGDIVGLVAGNNNLIDDTQHAGGLSGANHNIASTNLHLALPGLYGGPTVTVALNSNSPALGRGDPSLIPAGITTDQRGAGRTRNGTVDIGAFERAPTVLVVTTLQDEDDGSPEPALGSGTSLREAINFANVDPGGGDAIAFAPGLAGTLKLTQGALPTITANVVIVGLGANVLSIDALGNTNSFLSIASGANVVVSRLTLTGGAGGLNGGAIVNNGTLAIDSCALSGNTDTNGGAIFNAGTLTLTDSTLSGNKAFELGGAIYSKGALTLTNCTVSGNVADSEGGGLYSPIGATPKLVNCTVAGNSADLGAGIFGFNVTLNNTIVANNGAGGDIRGSVFGSNNLVDDAATAGGPAGQLSNGVDGNIVGLDAKLGPLAYNGGPTQTMAPLGGSRAIDGGASALAVDTDGHPLTTDQRGALRVKSSSVDIGAVEVGQSVVVVSNLSDANTPGTLRDALEFADDIDPLGTVTIVFAPGLEGTLALRGDALPPITGHTAIIGPGANLVTIDAKLQSNILEVKSGAAAVVVGLTFAHGMSDFFGTAGGITNFGSLVMRNCAVDGNTGVKGGVGNYGELVMLGCTVSNNQAFYTGGGVYNAGYAGLVNCTVANNSANLRGGGIENYSSGTLTLDNCTVAGNSAPPLEGAGVDNAIFSLVTLNNCIVATNQGGEDVAGLVAANDTLIGDQSPGGLVDPKLGPLGYYGGPTQTMPLLANSPAIDAGDNTLIPVRITTDQRGASRVNGKAVDLGAFETGVSTILVTTLRDEDNGSIDASDGTGTSLREALNFANVDPSGGDTIIFSPLLKGSIPLALGALPTISTSMTIQGPGADVLTVDAQGNSRVLSLGDDANVTLSGLTLANGSAAFGGGIANTGNLKLVACTISGSKATNGNGGGIYNAGTLSVSYSTLYLNQASNYGGGVFSQGALTLTNCTVVTNTANAGGGIYSVTYAPLTLTNCTVVFNAANTLGGGGGISGAGTMNNTIVSTNSYDDIAGPGFVGSNNLIGADAKLGFLAWNGGPTRTVPILTGSPAIGAGSAGLITKDQRGFPLDSPKLDIGAFQYQGPPPSVTISGPTTATVQIASSFTLQATDPSPADQHGTFTYTIDWNGDGSDVQRIQGPATLTVAHAYQATGTYQPNVVVMDQDRRTGSPPQGAAAVNVQPVTAQGVSQAILSSNTAISATNPTDFSIALGLVNQASETTWMGSNAATIQVQSAAPNTDAVINASSPNAPITVTGPAQSQIGALFDLSNVFGGTDLQKAGQIAVIVAVVAVSAGIAGGVVSELLDDTAPYVVAQIRDVASPLQQVVLDNVEPAVQAETSIAIETVIAVNETAAENLPLTLEDVSGMIMGQSPAVTVEQGNVTFSKFLLGTTTDAPTVLVTGGTLHLQGNFVTGNTDGSQPLIEVDGGTLLLGAADGTHPDILAVNGSAPFIHAALEGKVIVNPGTYFAQVSNGVSQPAGTTAIQLGSSAPIATTGQMVTFTATVTSDGEPVTDGSVEFFDNTTGAFLGMVPVTGGSASVQATLKDATFGDTIYATYLPDTGALAPSSDHVTQEVLAATTTKLTGPTSTPVFGTSVTFTATVATTSAGTPTGSVEFFDGATDLGAGTKLGGSSTTATSTFSIASLTAGSHTIHAVYTPTGLFQTSSDKLDLTISQATPTISVNPVNITFGTALANGQLSGAATWLVGGSKVTVSGTFAYTSAKGTVLGAGAGQSEAVTFTPDDSTDYTTASATVTVNVTQATPTVQVTDAGGTYNQNPFPATATVKGVNGVAGSSLEGVTPTLKYYSGSISTGVPLAGAPILPGTYTVKASFAGSTDYTSASATATFTINTPAPSISGAAVGVPGQPLTYVFSVSGPTQGVVFSINYGDGTSIKTAGPTAKLDHLYTATGSFTIQVTATDQNGVVTQLAKQIVNISTVAMEADPSGGTALAVGGSVAGGDTITVTAMDSTGKVLDVMIGKTDFGTFKPTGHIFVYAQGGKNSVTLKQHAVGVIGYIQIPAFVYAEGTGGDKLNATGSAANNVLVGHGNNEVLTGGQGRDLMIGGTGAATLIAGLGDDILVGGWTDYDVTSSGKTNDDKLAALFAIMAEWGSADSYPARLNKLAGLLNTTTVHDNFVNNVPVIDQLNGNTAANDWFFAGLNDIVTGKNKNDVVTAIK
jgi:CSLREA domain-containing protein